VTLQLRVSELNKTCGILIMNTHLPSRMKREWMKMMRKQQIAAPARAHATLSISILTAFSIHTTSPFYCHATTDTFAALFSHRVRKKKESVLLIDANFREMIYLIFWSFHRPLQNFRIPQFICSCCVDLSRVMRVRPLQHLCFTHLENCSDR